MVLVRPYLLGVDPDDIGHDALADVGSGEPSTGLRRRPRKTTSESDVTRTGVASSEIKPTESDEHTAEDSCKDDFPAQSSRHPDEHQIKLDTDRSFVLYPVGTHKLYIHIYVCILLFIPKQFQNTMQTARNFSTNSTLSSHLYSAGDPD